MTYITRIGTKRILAKYFLYSLQISYLHWKLSASRSIFSCYATYRQYYFEAIDAVISCIKDRFNQPGYITYKSSEEFLLKAAKQKD